MRAVKANDVTTFYRNSCAKKPMSINGMHLCSIFYLGLPHEARSIKRSELPDLERRNVFGPPKKIWLDRFAPVDKPK